MILYGFERSSSSTALNLWKGCNRLRRVLRFTLIHLILLLAVVDCPLKIMWCSYANAALRRTALIFNCSAKLQPLFNWLPGWVNNEKHPVALCSAMKEQYYMARGQTLRGSAPVIRRNSCCCGFHTFSLGAEDLHKMFFQHSSWFCGRLGKINLHHLFIWIGAIDQGGYIIQLSLQ